MTKRPWDRQEWRSGTLRFSWFQPGYDETMMKATKCARVRTFQPYGRVFGALAQDFLTKTTPIITLRI
eukprot:8497854-Pyramimonas_sp.AAC.1